MKLSSDRVPLVWAVAWRYLRGRRSQLLDRTARAALLSVSLGVAALVIAMALMTGYRGELEEKLVGGNGAILVYSLDPGRAPVDDAVGKTLTALPEVTRTSRVAYGQGTVSSPARPEGLSVTVRGVDRAAGSLGAGVSLEPWEDGVPAVLVGRDLARSLEVAVGDSLRLVAVGFDRGIPRFRYASLRLREIFSTGFAEFDQGWLVLHRDLLEHLAGGSAGQVLELEVETVGRAGVVAERVRGTLGDDYLVTDWQQMNRPLFSALALQQLALFVVLGLIVLVSTFNVASTLMVLVKERLRDVGVLVALGMARRRVAAIFVGYGLAIGAAGCLLGLAVGASAAWLLTTFEVIRFDPEVASIYFLEAVPFRVTIGDLATIGGYSLVVTVLSSLLPAWLAGRIDPAAALRYE